MSKIKNRWRRNKNTKVWVFRYFNNRKDIESSHNVHIIVNSCYEALSRLKHVVDDNQEMTGWAYESYVSIQDVINRAPLGSSEPF